MQRATHIVREGTLLARLLLDNGAEFEDDDFMPESSAPGDEAEIWRVAGRRFYSTSLACASPGWLQGTMSYMSPLHSILSCVINFHGAL